MFLLFFLLQIVVSQTTEIEGCAIQMTNNQCLQCDDGYYLVVEESNVILSNGFPKLKCQKAADENCENYVGTTCVKCATGYYLSNNECKQCTEHCSYCTSEICLVCNSGYELSYDEKQCITSTQEDYELLKGYC